MPYTITYPALAPLVSGVNDNPAAPIAAGAQLNHAHVTQATKHKTRKALRETQQATEEEVIRSKVRKTQVVAEHAADRFGPVPAWVATLQNSVNHLTEVIDHPQTGLAALGAAINHPQTGLAALGAVINHPQTGLAALGAAINHPQTGLAALGNTVNAIEVATNHPETGLAAVGGVINHPQTGLGAIGASINHPQTGLVAFYRQTARNSNLIAYVSNTAITVIPNNQGMLPGGNVVSGDLPCY